MGICTVPDWECVGRIGSHLGGFSKLFIYLFIHFGFTARLVGILVPWPGIKPRFMAVKARVLHHWTTREFLEVFFYLHFKIFECICFLLLLQKNYHTYSGLKQQFIILKLCGWKLWLNLTELKSRYQQDCVLWRLCILAFSRFWRSFPHPVSQHFQSQQCLILTLNHLTFCQSHIYDSLFLSPSYFLLLWSHWTHSDNKG